MYLTVLRLRRVVKVVIGPLVRRTTVGIKATVISGKYYFIYQHCSYVVDMVLHVIN